MGVLYAQSKRNRVVSKHGKLNTFVRPDEKEEQHRFVIRGSTMLNKSVENIFYILEIGYLLLMQ